MNEAALDLRYPVCIVGVGAMTPVGLTAPSTAAAVRAAIGVIGEHPQFIDKAGDPMSVARVPGLPPDLGGVDRFHALSAPALKEALAALKPAGLARTAVPLILGLPEPRPGLPKDLGTRLSALLDRSGDPSSPRARTETIPHGHSAGLMAIEEAWKRVSRGEVEFCVAGGVDSYLEGETLEWLDDAGQLMSAQNRSGFPPGEGAGFCLLASARAARGYGLDVLARVVSAATAREENRIKTETICVGLGLTRAIALATQALALGEKIDFTYCDLNGERYRSEEFAFSMVRAQASFVNASENLTPADCWGDQGAASGPLFAVLAVASGLRGYAKGPRALLWTSSEGGERTAVILHLRAGPA